MKKKIENYLCGEFVDYENKTHKVVICVITHTCRDYRHMHIGISICNPVDKYDESLGKKIAFSKAESSMAAMIADFGIITADVVNLILKQKLEHIQKFPEFYIAGYESAKNKYFDKIKAEEEFKNLDSSEQEIVKLLGEVSNLDYYKELAKKLK